MANYTCTINNPTSTPRPCNVAKHDTVQFLSGSGNTLTKVYFANNDCFSGGHAGLPVPSTSPYPVVKPTAGTYPFYDTKQPDGIIAPGTQVGTIKVG